jgi:hypothetical protein
MKKKCMVANIVMPSVFLACCIFWTIGCGTGVWKTGGLTSAGEKGGRIAIDSTGMKASLPDVVYNSAGKTFFVFWQSQGGPDMESRISCRILSKKGAALGETIVLSKGKTMRMLPKAAYNPFTQECMVAFLMMPEGSTGLDVYGLIIDAQGKVVVEQFPICTNPANQLHPSIAFNTVLREYFISYNDSRNGKGNGDIFGIILDERGKVRKPEFVINGSPGNQINPVVCHNTKDNTFLINWEDFRNEKELLKDPSNIMGALLDKDGAVLVNDIAMCVDTDGPNEGDQRFNGIVYNPDKNEFLTSWTDTRPTLKNAGIAGRIITAGGAIGSDFISLADDAGAQMISQAIYVPEMKKYFMVYEHNDTDLDVLYFMDKKAKLDIYARWLSDTGNPEGAAIPLCVQDGNQRFTRAAYASKKGCFFIAWQDDFPISKEPTTGHRVSPGGNIYGTVYGK